jgi:hypothetical protein
MSRKKRQQDLQQARDKKMKKVAVGLAVVLAVVLAFEVPKMLKHGGSSSAAPAQAVATTPSTSAAAPTTAAPTTPPAGTAAAAVTPVTSSKLPNSDTLPRAGKAQLFAFSHFASKDPFVQQVNPAATSSTSSSSSNSGSSTKYKPPTAAIGTTAAVTHQTGRALAVAGAARISVNGRIQVVRVGTSFPSANPVFRLVSVKGGVARIGIASGSYSSGAQTVSLTAGRTLTLVDTADGIRYQLRFLAA